MAEKKQHELVADSLTLPAVRFEPVRTVHHLEVAATPWRREDVDAWYRARVARLVAEGVQSTRDEDEAAAKNRFGKGWSGDVRELRNMHAPEQWKAKGRPAGK